MNKNEIKQIRESFSNELKELISEKSVKEFIKASKGEKAATIAKSFVTKGGPLDAIDKAARDFGGDGKIIDRLQWLWQAGVDIAKGDAGEIAKLRRDKKRFKKDLEEYRQLHEKQKEFHKTIIIPLIKELERSFIDIQKILKQSTDVSTRDPVVKFYKIVALNNQRTRDIADSAPEDEKAEFRRQHPEEYDDENNKNVPGDDAPASAEVRRNKEELKKGLQRKNIMRFIDQRNQESFDELYGINDMSKVDQVFQKYVNELRKTLFMTYFKDIRNIKHFDLVHFLQIFSFYLRFLRLFQVYYTLRINIGFDDIQGGRIKENVFLRFLQTNQGRFRKDLNSLVNNSKEMIQSFNQQIQDLDYKDDAKSMRDALVGKELKDDDDEEEQATSAKENEHLTKLINIKKKFEADDYFPQQREMEQLLDDFEETLANAESVAFRLAVQGKESEVKASNFQERQRIVKKYKESDSANIEKWDDLGNITFDDLIIRKLKKEKEIVSRQFGIENDNQYNPANWKNLIETFARKDFEQLCDSYEYLKEKYIDLSPNPTIKNKRKNSFYEKSDAHDLYDKQNNVRNIRDDKLPYDLKTAFAIKILELVRDAFFITFILASSQGGNNRRSVKGKFDDMMQSFDEIKERFVTDPASRKILSFHSTPSYITNASNFDTIVSTFFKGTITKKFSAAAKEQKELLQDYIFDELKEEQQASREFTDYLDLRDFIEDLLEIILEGQDQRIELPDPRGDREPHLPPIVMNSTASEYRDRFHEKLTVDIYESYKTAVNEGTKNTFTKFDSKSRELTNKLEETEGNNVEFQYFEDNVSNEKILHKVVSLVDVGNQANYVDDFPEAFVKGDFPHAVGQNVGNNLDGDGDFKERLKSFVLPFFQQALEEMDREWLRTKSREVLREQKERSMNFGEFLTEKNLANKFKGAFDDFFDDKDKNNTEEPESNKNNSADLKEILGNTQLSHKSLNILSKLLAQEIKRFDTEVIHQSYKVIKYLPREKNLGTGEKRFRQNGASFTRRQGAENRRQGGGERRQQQERRQANNNNYQGEERRQAQEERRQGAENRRQAQEARRQQQERRQRNETIRDKKNRFDKSDITSVKYDYERDPNVNYDEFDADKRAKIQRIYSQIAATNNLNVKILHNEFRYFFNISKTESASDSKFPFIQAVKARAFAGKDLKNLPNTSNRKLLLQLVQFGRKYNMVGSKLYRYWANIVRTYNDVTEDGQLPIAKVSAHIEELEKTLRDSSVFDLFSKEGDGGVKGPKPDSTITPDDHKSKESQKTKDFEKFNLHRLAIVGGRPTERNKREYDRLLGIMREHDPSFNDAPEAEELLGSINTSSKKDEEFKTQFDNPKMITLSEAIENLGNDKNLNKENSDLQESAPTIRWRRNPRTHLNKIVMTCKKGEYKKPRGRKFKYAGQEINDVMCMPKATKPASQQVKERRSSIKRWRKIKTNPAKMRRMKFRKALTKKSSKTIR